MVVGFTTVVEVLLLVVSSVEAVTSACRVVVDLIHSGLELFVVDVVSVVLDLLESLPIALENGILVGIYPLDISVSPCIVQLALGFFLLGQVLLVPVHQGLVVLASLPDLVGKLRVLVGNSNLLL